MNSLSKTLIYLGIIPFAASFAFFISSILIYGIQGDALFVLYSAIILSFIAGALWGKSKHNDHNHSSPILWSNIWAIASFFAVLLLWASHSAAISLLILLAGYTHILKIEQEQYKIPLASPHSNTQYLSNRRQVTAIVISLHLLMLLASLTLT